MTENNETTSMNELLEEMGSSIKKINTGDIIKGKVVTVNENEAVINIGYMSDGLLSKKDLSDDVDFDLSSILKPEDEILVSIVSMNDGEGNVLVSKKEADKIKSINDIEMAYNNSTPVALTIKEIVKGGVIGYLNGVRIFVPASLLSLRYVEDLKAFVDQTLEVRIIEFEKEANKIIASRKAIEEDEAKIKKEELWDTIKVGEKRKGTVSRLAAFGAFVDLGGIDGLIHISELSWNRVKNASEVVSVGDEVEVTVLNADKEKNRISLSLKDINANPINEVRNSLVIGSIVEGTVRKIMDFGAFVEIKNGVDGLVHISQISEDRVTKISEFINVGDKVKVKILDIDKKSNKISLSIKDASEGSNEDYSQYQKEESVSTSLADLLKGFKFE